MTYTVLNCKKYFCRCYYGQCPHNRIARIIQDEVYCEDFQHIDELDEDNEIDIE